jgi:D-alanyl-D-alanine carboxypeptidase
MLRDYPKYYPLFATRGYTFRGNYYHNHNRLLDKFEGLDGIKTGFVNASGFNLVASAVRNGRRLIAVVMGGNTAASRDVRMAELLEDGFHRPSRLPEMRLARAPVIPPSLPEMRDVALTSAPAPVPSTVPALPSARLLTPSAPPALGRPEPMRLVVASNDPAGRIAQATGWRDDGGDGWSIQVGAFSSKDAARRAIKAAQKKASKLLRDTSSSVMVQDDRLFRARFVGLEEHDARAVCKRLGDRTFPCAVISPGASSVAQAN